MSVFLCLISADRTLLRNSRQLFQCQVYPELSVYAYCHWRISLCNEFGTVLAGHKTACFRLYADLKQSVCIASYRIKHTKYTVWAELAFFNVEPGGTFSDHWASKDSKRGNLQITVIKKWRRGLKIPISIHVGRDSVVGVATRYGLVGPGIESRWGQDFPHPSTPAPGPTQRPLQWLPGLSRE